MVNYFRLRRLYMIKNFEFYFPTKVVFGNGSIKRVKDEAPSLGSKALIVTGKRSAEESGLLKKVTDQLRDVGINWVHFNEVKPNPTNLIVDKGAQLARREGCDFVIGLGGGSSIDTAKGIAVGAKSGLPIWKHIASWANDYEPITDALPILAIETLAGTSSESDNIAVVTNVKTNEKPGFASPLIFPRVAIIDPELTLTVSQRMTAITGFDILCHLVEGYVRRVANPICDILNERGIEYVVRYLPLAVQDGSNLEARGYLALANFIAGFSLTHNRATLLHAIEHPISGYFDVVHGEGLAALLPEWIRFSWKGEPDKFRIIGSIFGLRGNDNTKDNLVSKSREFLKSIGLDVRLSQLGVKRERFEDIARGALKYMAGGVKSNPVVASFEDIVKILNACY